MLCFYIRIRVMLLAPGLHSHAKQESNWTVRWKSKQILKASNQKVISAASQKIHKNLQLHTHSHTNCTKMIYAPENKDSTNCQLLSIKCFFALLLNQPGPQIYIKSLFNQNNDFCVLFITKQSWLRLQRPDKIQKEQCQSFDRNQPQSAAQRPDCPSLENGAVLSFGSCVYAIGF